jgi:hypothetical protein
LPQFFLTGQLSHPFHFIQQFRQSFLAVANHKHIEKITEGFRVKSHRPPSQHQRILISSLPAEYRYPRQI